MKKIFFILVILSYGFYSYSQETPVAWSVTDPVSYNEGFVVNIIAQIDTDWYIYGMQMEEGGPLPLLIDIENAVEKVKKYEVEEVSKATIIYDEVFGINVASHSKTVEIRSYFIPQAEEKTFNFIIDGQACSKKSGTCMPLNKTITIEII
jgi:hypothetical protein